MYDIRFPGGIPTMGYPLVNIQKTMERSTHFNGKINDFNGPCSIAICMFTRAYPYFFGDLQHDLRLFDFENMGPPSGKLKFHPKCLFKHQKFG